MLLLKLEYCLKNKLSNYVSMQELQFGFMKDGGCDDAQLIFKTVFEYYNNYGSTVFVVTIGSTKAHDRLSLCILILKLYDKGVTQDIVMMFVSWFQHFCAIVMWNGVSSSMFNAKSGVRQGGVGSCWLFNLYIN